MQLGATAEGGVQTVAQHGPRGGARECLAEVAVKARAAIDECGQIDGQNSADVFTEVSRSIE